MYIWMASSQQPSLGLDVDFSSGLPVVHLVQHLRVDPALYRCHWRNAAPLSIVFHLRLELFLERQLLLKCVLTLLLLNHLLTLHALKHLQM